MKKSFLPILIAITMVLCSACSQSNREDLQNNPEQYQPTGRFVETDITPPVPNGYRIWKVFSTNDTLECVAVLGGYYRFYSSWDGGKTWEEQESDWQDELIDQKVFVEAIGPDRSIWLYTWDMSVNEIWHISADGTRSQFPVPGGSKRIQQILPLTEDRVLIQHLTGAGLETESHTYVYDIQSGEARYSIPQDSVGTFRSSQSHIFLHQIYFYEETTVYLATFDIETGDKIQQNTGLHKQGKIPASVAADDSGYYYYINNDGLNRFVPGGAVTEILLEKDAYSFQQDGYFVTDMIVPDDQTIYICLGTTNLSIPGLLLKYSYEADAPVFSEPEIITPDGAAYYVQYNEGHNSFTGSLIKTDPANGDEVLVNDAFLVVFATEDIVVFRKQDGDFFTQSKHPWYCATLHYYDLNTGEVVDIFTDTFHKWKEHSQEPYEGQVLGANLDQKNPYYDPYYTISDGKLQFYVTRITDGFVDLYEYDFESRELELLKSVSR